MADVVYVNRRGEAWIGKGPKEADGRVCRERKATPPHGNTPLPSLTRKEKEGVETLLGLLCILIPVVVVSTTPGGWEFVGIAVSTFLLGILWLWLYLLPAWLAWDTKRFAAIFVLNLFLGWTLVGWAAALAWTLVERGRRRAGARRRSAATVRC